jgi:hypothetical protein
MNIRQQRTLFRTADIIIALFSIFLLLDATIGFTRPQQKASVQAQTSGEVNSPDLAAWCTGGFANQRTIGGVTQTAPHGTPFNAYQLTLQNIGSNAITVYGVSVDLVSSQNQVFARQRPALGDGAGLTLRPGQSREIVETAGVNHRVASCEILTWQSSL